MTTYSGGCHCGNIAVEFETDIAPADAALRECQCTFCRKHGVRTTTDPAGHVNITVKDEGALSRYRHGHGLAEFLVCMQCGSYVAAYMAFEDRAAVTLNVNMLDGNPYAGRRGPGADYSSESPEARAERRKQMWTPATLQMA